MFNALAYYGWKVKDQVDNNELCQLNHIQLIEISKILKDENEKWSIENLLTSFKSDFDKTLCNVEIMEFVLNYPASIKSLWKNKRIYFLGTRFASPKGNLHMFPLISTRNNFNFSAGYRCANDLHCKDSCDFIAVF
ncbi:MAG: hypothetical protein WDN09_00880 [bacterium]